MRQGSPVRDRRCPRNCERRVRGIRHWLGDPAGKAPRATTPSQETSASREWDDSSGGGGGPLSSCGRDRTAASSGHAGFGRRPLGQEPLRRAARRGRRERRHLLRHRRAGRRRDGRAHRRASGAPRPFLAHGRGAAGAAGGHRAPPSRAADARRLPDLWLSNLLLAGKQPTKRPALASALRRRAGPVVLVSNEVGMGLVPRRRSAAPFAMRAGRLNQEVAALPTASSLSRRGCRRYLEGGLLEPRCAVFPATVITGFLGAGKTSLVRHLLAHADGRRSPSSSMNSASSASTASCCSAAATRCNDDDIVELANGCLCCTVADDFLPTLTALLDRDAPPEHISSRLRAWPCRSRWCRPSLAGNRTRTTVDGVLTVIDGAAVAAGLLPPIRSRRAAARGGSGAGSRQPARGGLRGPARLRRSRGPQQDRPIDAGAT